jgi:hypothetical protein
VTEDIKKGPWGQGEIETRGPERHCGRRPFAFPPESARPKTGTMPRFTGHRAAASPDPPAASPSPRKYWRHRFLTDDDPAEAGRLALEYADDFRLFEGIGRGQDDLRLGRRLVLRNRAGYWIVLQP